MILTVHHAKAEEPVSEDLISVGVGYYDIFDNEDAADFRLEYRPDHIYFWNIKPWAGLEVSSDASLWAGGGVLADINVVNNFYVVPMAGVGYYAQGSSDLDLGHPIEFRTQLELAYKMENASRLGVAISHTSNSSLSDTNPGMEVVSAYYHIPLSFLK